MPAAYHPKRHAAPPTHTTNEYATIPPIQRETHELPTLSQSTGSDGFIPEDERRTQRSEIGNDPVAD